MLYMIYIFLSVDIQNIYLCSIFYFFSMASSKNAGISTKIESLLSRFRYKGLFSPSVAPAHRAYCILFRYEFIF